VVLVREAGDVADLDQQPGGAEGATAPVLLPYLVHLLLTALALAVLPRAPETRTQARTREPGTRAPLLPNSARTTRFRSITMPLAPWVFGSVTLAFITLPAHGIGTVAGLQVAVPGLLAALALAAGYGVQSAGRRLHAATTARHGDGRVAAVAGLAVVMLGCLASAYATARPGLATAALAAALLGAGYGLCLSTGLREVEETAAPDELGAVVSISTASPTPGSWCPTCSRSWRHESVTPGPSPQPPPRRDSPWCSCSCRDPARDRRLDQEGEGVNGHTHR